jgi:small-conductance mechanosensitive channel
MLVNIVEPHLALAQNSETPTSSEQTDAQRIVDEIASKLTAEEINALARARIQNTLIANNNVPHSLQSDKTSFVEGFLSGWQAYKRYIWNNIIGFPEMIKGSYHAVSAIFKGRSFNTSIQFIALLFAVLAIGLAAEFLAIRFTRKWRGQATKSENQNLAATLNSLGQRFALELAGLAAFTAAALIAAQIIFSDPFDEHLISNFVILAILVVRLMSTFLRFTLDPGKTSMRLVSADDWTAHFIYSNFTILTAIVGVGLYILALMTQFETSGVKPFRFWVGLFIYGYVVYVTWRARNGLTSIIKGQDEHLTPGLERMAAWWPVISIIVMIGQYTTTQIAHSTGEFNISPGKGVVTLLIIVLLPFMDTMVRGIIKYMVPPMQGEGSVAELAYYQTLHSYARMGRVLLISILIFVIGLIWGINFQNLAASGIGAQLAANLLGSVMVLAVGYLIWETVNLWINQQLAKDTPATESEDPGGGEGGGAGKSRMATVLPLIRMALQTTIITITALLALSRLGVNITPLLAGAGVLGLAVGFGAQTLVKDIVSGVFFLVDDAFRVGEYLDIEGTVGSVEKISVRSLQLRHPNGPVHIVPYGEIPKLTNHSRDYVIMKLRFTVPFDTDLEKVRKIFKKIGQDMMENPALAENFINPFKSQGAAEVNDVGIVVRGKFTTKPGAQWAVRKEVYSRVQKAFEENSIDFARKEVRVQIPGLERNENFDERQKEAIKMAAGSVADEEEDPGKIKKKEPDPF